MSDERDRARFRTTRWSLVVAAADSAHIDFRNALASLCETYWFPVYAYVRRWGCDPDRAQDLTQGFFTHVLEQRTLRMADPERGRFRSFLLTAVKNYMANERDRERAAKRGGGRAALALDLDTAEQRYRLEAVDARTPDRLYAQRWALALLERTMERLREEAAMRDDAKRFDRLSRFLTDHGPGMPYREVAAELEMSESAVKVAVHRLRKRFGRLLRDEVEQTVEDPARVDEEIRFLFDALEP